MKFTVVGDVAIQKNFAEYDGFETVRDFIARGDVRFFNLETTVNEGCYANAFSGGTWLRTDRSKLEDTKKFGFNLTTFANNHALDFSIDGLCQTIDAVREAGYVCARTGRDLAGASSPKYLSTSSGRVALIAFTADFAPGGMAGERSRDFPGRPGVNGLRIGQTLIVTPEQAEALRQIATATKVNATAEYHRANGYNLPLPENCGEFDTVQYEIGPEPGIRYELNRKDLARMEKAVKEAALQADEVIVSIHSHRIWRGELETPHPAIAEFAHRCVDAGATVVLGHGPHLLQPMELYQGRPIFYSLGDFILHLENFEKAPEDFYEKYGLTSDAGIYELLQVRTKNFTIGLQRQPKMMESVIPYFEIENGTLKKLEFLPVELGCGMDHASIGWPRVCGDRGILERFAAMCEPYGVEIEIKDGLGIWRA